MSQLKSHERFEAVAFGERLAGSSQFDRLFADGMGLVERTAAYLDTDGRADARKLAQPISIAYATESMRLTTRLLEIASWLLIRRSLKNGELTLQEAQAKRARLKIGGSGRPGHIAQFDQLPEKLRALITESFELTDRVLSFERAIVTAPSANAGDPVGDQRARIETAFAGRLRLVVSN
jgi:regulator of CtrA degradation